MDAHLARVLLEWQLELGAYEAIGDLPVDRYALAEADAAARAAKPVAAAAARSAVPVPQAMAGPDAVAVARAAAAAAMDLDGLRAALADFDLCDLKRGARQLVFADGVPGARVMIVNDAPGRDEDRAGVPFVGQEAQLLDRMLAAIGLARETSVYIANVIPWRPLQKNGPNPDEIAMLVPFLERHIALAAPEILVVMGNVGCQALLGKSGLTRLRGRWASAQGLPVLPMFPPFHLLRQPAAKREAWADLLSLKAKLNHG